MYWYKLHYTQVKNSMIFNFFLYLLKIAIKVQSLNVTFKYFVLPFFNYTLYKVICTDYIQKKKSNHSFTKNKWTIALSLNFCICLQKSITLPVARNNCYSEILLIISMLLFKPQIYIYFFQFQSVFLPLKIICLKLHFYKIIDLCSFTRSLASHHL